MGGHLLWLPFLSVTDRRGDLLVSLSLCAVKGLGCVVAPVLSHLKLLMSARVLASLTVRSPSLKPLCGVFRGSARSISGGSHTYIRMITAWRYLF